MRDAERMNDKESYCSSIFGDEDEFELTLDRRTGDCVPVLKK